MKKLYYIVSRFVEQMKEDNLNTYASSCAFFVFLSFIPMLILICAIIPFTPLKATDALTLLTNAFPQSTGTIIRSIVEEVYARSAGIISVAAIATLWSAGKGINSLIYGLNAIEDYQDKRNPILVRLIATLYTLVFLVSIMMFLLVMVYGNVAIDLLESKYPQIEPLLEFAITMRPIVVVLVMTLIFTLCYGFLPSKKLKLRQQIPGAFFTSVVWTIFSFGFSFYVDRTNAFSIYGSFTTIIILMFWIYCCMYIVLIGANMNKYFRPVMRFLEGKRKGEDDSTEV